MIRAIIISSLDNTATLFDKVTFGERVSIILESGEVTTEIRARQEIPVGHKIALVDIIPTGGRVTKYGELIGLATCEISKGDHVHIHNVVSAVLPQSRVRSRGGQS